MSKASPATGRPSGSTCLASRRRPRRARPPGMGGPELIEALTAERPHLRTICASGYTDNAVFRDGAGGSQLPYLSKPFTAEALLTLVRQVLDGPALPPILG